MKRKLISTLMSIILIFVITGETGVASETKVLTESETHIANSIKNIRPEIDKVIEKGIADKLEAERKIEEEKQRKIEEEKRRAEQKAVIENLGHIFTDSEIRDLSALVYLEGGNQSYECKKAIASVVINRMAEKGKSLYDVMYEQNQFTPAYLISATSPTEECITAVRDILKNGTNIPKNVTYFRTGYYHNWSNHILPFALIDDTYFSYDDRI